MKKVGLNPLQHAQGTILKTIFWLAIFGGFLLSFSPLARAQTAGRPALDLEVTPPTQYVHIKPGDTRRVRYTVTHRGRQPIQITPQVSRFDTDGLTGNPIIVPESNPNFVVMTMTNPQATDVIDPQTQQIDRFILEPDKPRTVELILLPDRTEPNKEMLLTILFEAQPFADETMINGANPSETSLAIGANLIALLSSDDPTNTQLYIDSFKTKPFIDSFESLQFQALAENTAHHAEVATGSATITNWRGKVVAEFPVMPIRVLGKKTRLLQTVDIEKINEQTENQVTADNYAEYFDGTQVTDIFKYDDHFLFGPYTLTVDLTDPTVTDTERPKARYYTKTQIVWAFPYGAISIMVFSALSYVLFQSVVRYMAQKK